MTKKFIVVGSGKLAVKIAEYLKSNNLNVCVYEHKISSYSSVKDICLMKEIPYHTFTSQEMSRQLELDLKLGSIMVISAMNTYIFPKHIVDDKNFFGINYHNALLPNHRGMNAEAWSIFEMDKETGITWHLISSGVDTGDIIAQKVIPLDEKISSLKLLKKQCDIAFETFLEFSNKLISGDIETQKQPNVHLKMHKIKDVPNNGYINLKWSFDKMVAFIRAMDYGKLEVLHKPKLKLDTSTYVWNSYKVLSCDKGTVSSKDRISVKDKNIVIEKKGVDKKLLLMNISQGKDF
ncbi:MAG: hypothetical protein LIO71_00925 [Ruminococcus sp.]|nr:hypothetical protein [Ruminococcus sp.]